MCPGLVAYRIWTIERKVSAVRVTKRKIPLLRVFVDAAILYSVALCSFIVIIYAYSSAVFYVMGDMVITLLITCLLSKILTSINQLIPIISIAFYMVFIRIAISKHTQDGWSSETERGTLQFRIQPWQSGPRQNDMSWPTAQK